MDRDPPGQRPPRQRPPWTETPLDRDPLPVNRITDTCKNITFPQLRLRTVTINHTCHECCQSFGKQGAHIALSVVLHLLTVCVEFLCDSCTCPCLPREFHARCDWRSTSLWWIVIEPSSDWKKKGSIKESLF